MEHLIHSNYYIHTIYIIFYWKKSTEDGTLCTFKLHIDGTMSMSYQLHHDLHNFSLKKRKKTKFRK